MATHTVCLGLEMDKNVIQAVAVLRYGSACNKLRLGGNSEFTGYNNKLAVGGTESSFRTLVVFFRTLLDDRAVSTPGKNVAIERLPRQG